MFKQDWINHCAGCTMGGAPRRQAVPINSQIFTTLFRHLNVQCRLKQRNDVTTTTKKGRQLYEEGKCTPEKILATRMRKGPPPYVGMRPPNG